MKNRLTWILGAIMGGSIIGLLITQSFWISNALQIKQKQFDQIVMQSAANIMNEINRYQEYSFLFGRDFSYHFDTSFSDISSQQGLHSYQSYSIDIHVKDRDKDYSKMEDKRDIRKKQAIKDFISGQTDIESILSEEVLSKIITDELQNMGINLAFEYAVLRPDNTFTLQTNGFNAECGVSIYKVRFPSKSFFSTPDFLWIYFPAEKKFLFQSLGFVTITSLVLILILIISSILVSWFFLKQKRLSEIKNDFISNMTHELKTPISTISLASQMLNDKSIPAESMDMGYITGLIDEESKRLGYQVEKVLQTAILDGGKIRLKLKKMDANLLIDDVINNFEIQVLQKNGKIIKRLQACETEIMADEVHLSNVLLNLLDNAVKYSTGAPEITISTSNENGNLVIRLKDNGIGISKKDQKSIFEKFYRVSTGNIHTVKGFGLGLHYVKNIVEEHKGRIYLWSEMGKGTEFIIKLHNSIRE